MYDSIWTHQSVNIRKISKNRAEQVAYYRFLENSDVTISELTYSLSIACQQQVSGRHVLAMNDTSEINLQAHVGRLKPDTVGVVGNNKDVGFFIHPTLVLDADTGFLLGISAVQLWTRQADRSGDRSTRRGIIVCTRDRSVNDRNRGSNDGWAIEDMLWQYTQFF